MGEEINANARFCINIIFEDSITEGGTCIIGRL